MGMRDVYKRQGNDGGQPLQLGGRDPHLGNIDIKRGHHVEEEQAHRVHLTAKVLAGKPVRGLMDEAEYEKEQPELRQIQKALVGKVVIELHVGLDRTPAGDEDRCLKEEERHHGHHAPGTVNIFAGHTVEPGEILSLIHI